MVSFKNEAYRGNIQRLEYKKRSQTFFYSELKIESNIFTCHSIPCQLTQAHRSGPYDLYDRQNRVYLNVQMSQKVISGQHTQISGNFAIWRGFFEDSGASLSSAFLGIAASFTRDCHFFRSSFLVSIFFSLATNITFC